MIINEEMLHVGLGLMYISNMNFDEHQYELDYTINILALLFRMKKVKNEYSNIMPCNERHANGYKVFMYRRCCKRSLMNKKRGIIPKRDRNLVHCCLCLYISQML